MSSWRARIAAQSDRAVQIWTAATSFSMTILILAIFT